MNRMADIGKVLTSRESLTMAVAVVLIAILASLPGRTCRPNGTKSAPIAQGRQTYFVSSKEKGPKITEVVIDPFDPKCGERQMMSVRVNYPEPVKSVSVTARLDKGEHGYPLALVEGNGRNGRWEGSWRTSDSHDTTYDAVVKAEGPDYTSTVWLTLRP